MANYGLRKRGTGPSPLPVSESTDSLMEDDPGELPSPPRLGNGREEDDEDDDDDGKDVQQAREKVSKSESKLRKVLTRAVFGFAMIFAFLGIVYAGHIYVCMIIVLLQSMVFKEMVNVRYRAAKEKEIPLFRTLQWTWFATAISYAYGDFLHQFAIQHEGLFWLAHITKWNGWLGFNAYCALFVLSVLTLRKGLYRYQVGQLTWTIVTIMMIVAQLRFVAHNIFNGMFWFFHPSSLVVANDCFAYFCGMALGRKLIKKPFLKISPNKTWEGFLGAMVCTLVYAWYSSAWLADMPWFVCPVDDISLTPSALSCEPNYIFLRQDVTVPVFSRLLDWFYTFVSGKGGASLPTMNFPGGFEAPVEEAKDFTTLHVLPIQLYSLVMAMFVSLIAPFGGFWASAIKRAYGIKDFDSIIPGHGGVTDRMDCQFITALFVFVFHDTFIRPSMVTVGGLLSSASLLPVLEQQELYSRLGKMIEGVSGD